MLLIEIIEPCLINVFLDHFKKAKHKNLTTLSKDEFELLEKIKFK